MEFLVLQMEYIIIFILLVFITVYVMNYVVYYIILCQSGLDAYTYSYLAAWSFVLSFIIVLLFDSLLNWIFIAIVILFHLDLNRLIQRKITIISYIIAIHNIYSNLSTEPSTKSLVPNIDIRSATRWLWEIIFNAWKLY